MVERVVRDVMTERKERVVVQCKHHAHCGKSVGDSDVGVWRCDESYKARGYLLVTDTRVTENLSRSFREFTNDEINYPDWASFWDVDALISHLAKYPTIREAFFGPFDYKLTHVQKLASEVTAWLAAIRYRVTEGHHMGTHIIEFTAALTEGSIADP